MSETGSGDKNNVVEPTHAEEEVRVPMHDDTVVNPNQEETLPGEVPPTAALQQSSRNSSMYMSFPAPSANISFGLENNSSVARHKSAFDLLTKPFRHPVGEDEALENAVRQTLGHELLVGEDSNEEAHFVLQDNPEPGSTLLNSTHNNASHHFDVSDLEKSSFDVGNNNSNNNNNNNSGPSLNTSLALHGSVNLNNNSSSNMIPEIPRTYVFRYNIRLNQRPPPFTTGTHVNVEDIVIGEAADAGNNNNNNNSNKAHGSSASSESDSEETSAFSTAEPSEDGSHASHGSSHKNKKGKHGRRKKPHPQPPSPQSVELAPPPPTEDTQPVAPPGQEGEKKKVHFSETGTEKAADPPGAAPPIQEEEEGKGTYLNMGCFFQTPIPASDVALEENVIDSFNALSSETRRLEMLEAFYVAHVSPFENNASFTGDNWNSLVDGDAVDKWFDIAFDDTRYCFYVTVFKRRFRVFLFSYLLRGFVIFIMWVIMFNMLLGKYFSPGGLYFDTFSTIIFAGLVGTLGAYVVRVPTIVGVIWAGILYNNVPYVGRLTGGINSDMRQFIGMLGLSIGIVRAGLSLNVIRFKQKFKHFICFSCIPASVEMVVHGVCARYIFHYDSWKICFAEGFLVASIAPSVIVPIIISYQRKGYGVRDGPPMMILCSIAIDTALCIWGIQFLLALEFKRMNTALLIVLAPVQILVGIIGGIILGFVVFVVTFFILFMEGERLPAVRNDRKLTIRHSVHIRYISILFMVLIAFCEISIGFRFNCIGGSAIAVVFTAGSFNYFCVRGGTRDHLQVKAEMAQSLTTLWDYIAMPALFGLSGANVNVHQLFDRSFIGQAFALVFIGMGVRSLAAMGTPLMTRLGLNWRELIFCGVGWIGKGSVQGALGSTCYNYAVEARAKATTPEEYAWATQRMADGIKMKNVAILGILVACPICSIFLSRFTGKLLTPGT